MTSEDFSHHEDILCREFSCNVDISPLTILPLESRIVTSLTCSLRYLYFLCNSPCPTTLYLGTVFPPQKAMLPQNEDHF